MEREFALDASCPQCGRQRLTVRSSTQDMPYFGETLHTVVLCGACDFRHATSMVLAQKEPCRHTLRFRAPGDLGVRVVRSQSGTYRIPELGFVAEPAEASEAFVSNVEGVLERVRDILVRARVMYAEDERGAQAEALLLKLQRIVEGKEGATLVLEDPHGTSAILSEQASREKLSPDEAALLRTGVIMLDARDVESN